MDVVDPLLLVSILKTHFCSKSNHLLDTPLEDLLPTGWPIPCDLTQPTTSRSNSLDVVRAQRDTTRESAAPARTVTMSAANTNMGVVC
jgi:hypothetical protein